MKEHSGCRDKTHPRERRYYRFNRRVCFTLFSSWWKGLACGLVDDGVDDVSHGVAYLVTREQFEDVMMQENGFPIPEVSG
jgi:hypothetical protein